MHVHPIPPDEATGEVKAHYDAAIADDGYLQNQELLFGLNPAAKAAWRELVRSITSRMDRQRCSFASVVKGIPILGRRSSERTRGKRAPLKKFAARITNRWAWSAQRR